MEDCCTKTMPRHLADLYERYGILEPAERCVVCGSREDPEDSTAGASGDASTNESEEDT